MKTGQSEVLEVEHLNEIDGDSVRFLLVEIVLNSNGKVKVFVPSGCCRKNERSGFYPRPRWLLD